MWSNDKRLLLAYLIHIILISARSERISSLLCVLVRTRDGSAVGWSGRGVLEVSTVALRYRPANNKVPNKNITPTFGSKLRKYLYERDLVLAHMIRKTNIRKTTYRPSSTR